MTTQPQPLDVELAIGKHLTINGHEIPLDRIGADVKIQPPVMTNRRPGITITLWPTSLVLLDPRNIPTDADEATR